MNPRHDRFAALIADLPQDMLAFAPVPVALRTNGWTAERQRGFIARLALCGSPGMAARSVNMSRESAYRLRVRPDAEAFAAAWDRAAGFGLRRLDDLAIERALLGEVRPVFYRGRQVGEQVRHNNRLLITTLDRATRAEARAAENKGVSRRVAGDPCDPSEKPMSPRLSLDQNISRTNGAARHPRKAGDPRRCRKI